MREMKPNPEPTIDEKTVRSAVRRARLLLAAQIIGFLTYVTYTLNV